MRRKLVVKFPKLDHVNAPSRLVPQPPEQIPVDTVAKVIEGSRMGAGCGPTGLRAFFLAQCIGKDDDDACAGIFQNLIQLLAEGRAPTYLRRWYGGGGLMGVGKEDKPLDTDARPIVSGEDWRKITFKCTLEADKKSVMERLQPHQLSVGVKAGVDAMIHASRKWIDDNVGDTSAVFFARDKKNAFNAANPAEFLADCAEYMPSSARFAEYCYGAPVNLVYRGKIEQSYRGQQGCPSMGPMFCLMQKRFTEEARARVRIGEEIFEPELADDSYVGGSAASVLEHFKAERACAPRYGIDFELDKCKLYLLAGDQFVGDVQEFEAMGVEICRKP